MSKNIKLSASIMCANWLNLSDDIIELEKNKIDYIHIDIVDGIFAPDFTMGSSIINTIREQTDIPFHYHLMVEEPSRIFDSLDLRKSDIFTIHQETSKNLHSDLINIKKRGVKTAVALSPATPLDHLEYILDEVDDVLILTVNPGFKGQKIIPQIIKKISKLREMLNSMNLKSTITVDGNVNIDTIPDFIRAGANILVLGSSGLFLKKKNISISQAIQNIRKCVGDIK